MEELGNIAQLEREILEDAEKKAKRIRSAAVQKREEMEREFESRTVAALQELEQRFALRFEAAKTDPLKTLPLEKKRMMIAWLEEQITASLRDYLSQLDDAVFLAMLDGFFAGAAGFLEKHSIDAICAGLSNKTVLSVLQKSFPDSKVSVNQADKSDLVRGVFVTRDDNMVRLEASANIIIAQLLRQHRLTLAKALYPELELEQ